MGSGQAPRLEEAQMRFFLTCLVGAGQWRLCRPLLAGGHGIGLVLWVVPTLPVVRLSPWAEIWGFSLLTTF